MFLHRSFMENFCSNYRIMCCMLGKHFSAIDIHATGIYLFVYANGQIADPLSYVSTIYTMLSICVFQIEITKTRILFEIATYNIYHSQIICIYGIQMQAKLRTSMTVTDGDNNVFFFRLLYLELGIVLYIICKYVYISF